MNTITFSKNLRKFRSMKGLSKTELAKRVGVSDVMIGYWESGKNEPRMGKVEMIADVLGVSIDDLLFEETPSGNNLPPNAIPVKGKSWEVPLYGSIAAGVPLEMLRVEEYIEVPEAIAENHPTAFLLKVNGDSMNKIVPNGAYALIDPSEEVNNGDVAAVAVNGQDATLKRFYQLHNTIALEPDSYNPEHVAKLYDSNSEDSANLRLIGKMVWYMSPVNIKY
ncbi:helix-turn-helix domain-containing protein [Cohnella panacarvi]|uniref:helix-turn-helix domain-containing protein n=1 Tax=Cohnella panacarvi TaxID=400776 RepID=UPI001FE13005|nr:LexA family transcriptional regulator [Cohnella panacarvi]